MEIYLYCSYEQSQKGFCLTKIAGDELVLCPKAPEIIGEFFYYDRYQILWRDIPDDTQPNKREIAVCGSFFGLRGLKGRIRGERWGNANVAFLAENDEDITALRRIGIGILGDVDSFTVMLLRQLSIGGDAGYQLDVPVFQEYINRFTAAARLKPLVDTGHPAMGILPFLKRQDPARTSQDLVRFAVSVADWEDPSEKTKKGFWNRRRILPILKPEQYQTIFTGNGPIWELYPAE